MDGQVGYMNQQQMQPGMGGMDPGQMMAMGGMDGQVGYMNQQQMGIEDEQNYMAAEQTIVPGGGAVDHGLITEQPSADPGGNKRGGKLSKEEKRQKKERKKMKKDTMPDAPLPDHEASNALAHNWHEMREYFESLNIPTVLLWDYREVAERFLRPLGLAPLSQIFIEHKINGRTLLGLDKGDLKQMQVKAVGDRVLIHHAVRHLKRMQVRQERDRVIWEGYTPFGSFQYYRGIPECLTYRVCPCMVSTTKYKITPVGIRKRTDPPACNCKCEGVEHDNLDIRFMKDVDWGMQTCCWCWHKKIIDLTFQNNNDDDEEQGLKIAHPDVGDDLVADIQNIWAEARLVAD